MGVSHFPPLSWWYYFAQYSCFQKHRNNYQSVAINLITVGGMVNLSSGKPLIFFLFRKQ